MFVILDQYVLVVNVYDDNVVMMLQVNLHDDGFDRRIAFDQDAWVGVRVLSRYAVAQVPDSPASARGMLTTDLRGYVG